MDFYYAEYTPSSWGPEWDRVGRGHLYRGLEWGRLVSRSAWYTVSRKIVPLAHAAGLDVEQNWYRGEFDFGPVKLMPWADDGDTIRFRIRSDPPFSVPTANVYPLETRGFHRVEMQFWADPAFAWNRIMRPDQRDMVHETKDDSLETALSNVVIEHAHAASTWRAPSKVPIEAVGFLGRYDAKRFYETLPWDCARSAGHRARGVL